MDVFLMDYGYCSAEQRIGDMIAKQIDFLSKTNCFPQQINLLWSANQFVLLFQVLFEAVMSNV